MRLHVSFVLAWPRNISTSGFCGTLVCDKVPIFVHGFEANGLGYTLVMFEVQRPQITGDIERYMSMFC